MPKKIKKTEKILVCHLYPRCTTTTVRRWDQALACRMFLFVPACDWSAALPPWSPGVTVREVPGDTPNTRDGHTPPVMEPVRLLLSVPLVRDGHCSRGSRESLHGALLWELWDQFPDPWQHRLTGGPCSQRDEVHWRWLKGNVSIPYSASHFHQTTAELALSPHCKTESPVGGYAASGRKEMTIKLGSSDFPEGAGVFSVLQQEELCSWVPLHISLQPAVLQHPSANPAPSPCVPLGSASNLCRNQCWTSRQPVKPDHSPSGEASLSH